MYSRGFDWNADNSSWLLKTVQYQLGGNSPIYIYQIHSILYSQIIDATMNQAHSRLWRQKNKWNRRLHLLPVKIIKEIIAVKEILSGKLAGKFKRRNSELSVILWEIHTENNFWDTFEGRVEVNQKLRTFVA